MSPGLYIFLSLFNIFLLFLSKKNLYQSDSYTSQLSCHLKKPQIVYKHNRGDVIPPSNAYDLQDNLCKHYLRSSWSIYYEA